MGIDMEYDEGTAMMVYMVFKNIRSLMNGILSKEGGFVFTQVPENEEVMLVALGKSGEQLLYAQTGYFRLNKDQPASLQMEKISQEEMTARINALQ